MTRNDPFALELSADLIVRAYQAGIFPMAETADSDDVFWVSPHLRGILPLDGFHLSHSLKKRIRRGGFSIRIDSNFDAVIKGCATEGSDRDDTWINRSIRTLYRELFDRHVCHTVEVWDDGELIGGLYGLAIGGAFFGESMFHRRTDASKIALAALVCRLRLGGFSLLDVQFLTPHLASLGGVEVPRESYEQMLGVALKREADFYRWDGGGTLDDCLQSTSQTS